METKLRVTMANCTSMLQLFIVGTAELDTTALDVKGKVVALKQIQKALTWMYRYHVEV
jgi:hypothetical protein